MSRLGEVAHHQGTGSDVVEGTDQCDFGCYQRRVAGTRIEVVHISIGTVIGNDVASVTSGRRQRAAAAACPRRPRG